MTRKDIIEGSELIAEFHELTVEPTEKNFKAFYSPVAGEEGAYISISELRYHVSWDWLMPVINSIGKLNLNHEPFSGISIYSDIHEVFNAVVDFIKYYNQEKQNP
jgi:hypothetical protein